MAQSQRGISVNALKLLLGIVCPMITKHRVAHSSIAFLSTFITFFREESDTGSIAAEGFLQ